MRIEADEVRRVAALARLELDDGTVERFRLQLEAIMDYVAMLETLDVASVDPTASTLEAGQPLREDEPRPCLDREQALANAPDTGQGHFRVPQVLKG